MTVQRRALPQHNLLAALDLGSAKVSCLIARREADGALTPLGVGQQSMRRGADAVVVDPDATTRLIAVAADEAMRMAGAPLPKVMVSYGGLGAETVVVTGVAPIAPSGVTQRAMDAALGAAMRAASRKGRKPIGVGAARYRIDGAEQSGSPLGKLGSTLTCEATAITAPDAVMDAVRTCCTKAGLVVQTIQPAPMAAGVSATTAKERETGVFVIDLGAAHTALAQFVGGDVRLLATHGAGGDSVTDALAKALATTRAAAERVKIAHADLSGAGDPRAVVEFARLNEDGRLSPGVAARASIDAAVRGAWLALFAQVRDTIEWADRGGRLPVVLSGGGALTPGLAPIAERALGRQARIGAPLGFGVLDGAEGGPAFSVSCGLLAMCDLNPVQTASAAAPVLRANFTKAWSWLRENL